VTDTSTTERKRPKGRSPSYPGIPLEAAVDRARALYAKEGQYPAPIETIYRHWGYKGISGTANVTLAALKKFGLLVDEGSGTERVARLTDLAIEIIENPDAQARLTAIKQAALTPSIHRELWDQHQERGMPSPETLKYELKRKRGFTDSGADDFISQYGDTVAYAQLGKGATVGGQEHADGDDGGNDGGGGADDDGGKPHRPPGNRSRQQRPRGGGGMSNEPGTLAIPIPVIGGSPILIEGEFPVTEAAWDQFLAVLQAMKPGLVQQPESAAVWDVDEDGGES